MRAAGSYLGMQMKRMLRLLPVLLAAAVVTLGVLMLCGGLLLHSENRQEGKQRFRIGMVGDFSDQYLGFGISLIQAMDDSRFVIELIPMEEEEALSRFRRGELSAYVRVPDGLLDSIVYGRNDKPLVYYCAEGQQGIEGILGGKLADIVSVLVTRSQSAVFGMQEIVGSHGGELEFWEATERMNLRLFDIVLNRTGLYRLEELGVSGGLSAAGYYMGAFLVLFLLLSGIHASPLLIRRSSALPGLMKSRDVGVFWQVLGEYAAFALMELICSGIVFLALYAVLEGGSLELAEWKGLGAGPLGGLFRAILPVMLMLSAMQYWLYELMTGVVSALTAQFLGGISMAYLAGVFYPASFLPGAMRRLGELLPVGAAFGYIQEKILDELSLGTILSVFLYLFLFLGLSVLIRSLRIERGRQG